MVEMEEWTPFKGDITYRKPYIENALVNTCTPNCGMDNFFLLETHMGLQCLHISSVLQLLLLYTMEVMLNLH